MDTIEFHEEQLAKARSEGDQRLAATHLGSLGNAYAARGNIRKAIQCLEEAIQIWQRLDDRDRTALCYKNLDNILWQAPVQIIYKDHQASGALPWTPQQDPYQLPEVALELFHRTELGLIMDQLLPTESSHQFAQLTHWLALAPCCLSSLDCRVV